MNDHVHPTMARVLNSCFTASLPDADVRPDPFDGGCPADNADDNAAIQRLVQGSNDRMYDLGRRAGLLEAQTVLLNHKLLSAYQIIADHIRNPAPGCPKCSAPMVWTKAIPADPVSGEPATPAAWSCCGTAIKAEPMPE